MQNKISELQGKRLLKLARDTIGYRLGVSSAVSRDGLEYDIFQQQFGTFVTLKIDNQLRGCIGNLEPVGTIVDAVNRNALGSAFHDHRFSPLEAGEFAKVRIDISILTAAKRVYYRDSDELLMQLQPGTDGVILELGKCKATFLPQVWSQLPTPEIFLRHLCLKAGLSADAWKNQSPEISVYQVQCFEEDDQ